MTEHTNTGFHMTAAMTQNAPHTMPTVLTAPTINGFVGSEPLTRIEHAVLGYCPKAAVNFTFTCDALTTDPYRIMCVVGALLGDVGVGGDIPEGYVRREVHCAMYCGNGEDKEVKHVVSQLQTIPADAALTPRDVQVLDPLLFSLCDTVGEIGEPIDYDDPDLKQTVEDYAFEAKSHQLVTASVAGALFYLGSVKASA